MQIREEGEKEHWNEGSKGSMRWGREKRKEREGHGRKETVGRTEMGMRETRKIGEIKREMGMRERRDRPQERVRERGWNGEGRKRHR